VLDNERAAKKNNPVGPVGIWLQSKTKKLPGLIAVRASSDVGPVGVWLQSKTTKTAGLDRRQGVIGWRATAATTTARNPWAAGSQPVGGG